MWSASRSTSRRSFVASPPTILIARPGPGKGWRRTSAPAGLDHVRVERSLDQKADGPILIPVGGRDLRRLLLEDPDELRPDRFALGLRLDHAPELLEEPALRVDGHERDLEGVAKGAHHLFALVLAHQPVVHEHARELITRASPTCSRMRRI